MNRRRFLRNAGAAAVTLGASALGLDLLLEQTIVPSQTTTTTSGDRTPPIIREYRWQPSRVVNAKVYDVVASFAVEDDQSSVADVITTLQGYGDTLPARAYPAEPPRTFRPTSTGTSGKITKYAAEVGDLIGGKKYRLTVSAKDLPGNQTEATFETPYVREYESISGKDDVLFGAFYFTWFTSHGWQWNNVQATNGSTAYGTPLLGLYGSGDQNVIARHIDWAQRFGIDYFAVYVPRSKYLGIQDAGIDPLVQSPLMNDFKFTFLYNIEDLPGRGDLTNPNNYAQVKEDFTFMAAHYFSHPSFLKTKGMPVVQMDITADIKTDIAAGIAQLRNDVRDAGYEMFLIGGEMAWKREPIDLKRLRAFDAISAYGFPPGWARYQAPSATLSEYSRWQDAARAADVELVPSTFPGFDNRQTRDRTIKYSVTKSPEFLAANMKVGLKFLDKSRIMTVASYNDWGEDRFIEPTLEDDFKYLQTIRDTLATSS